VICDASKIENPAPFVYTRDVRAISAEGRSMFENKTYDVNCRACGVKNNLKRSDLGRKLNCGACGEAFKYDKPLRVEKAKRNAIEAKRRAERQRRSIVRFRRCRASKNICMASRPRYACPSPFPIQPTPNSSRGHLPMPSTRPPPAPVNSVVWRLAKPSSIIAIEPS